MSTSKLFHLLSVLALLTVLPAAHADAQGSYRLRGRVVDGDTGEQIPGALVAAVPIGAGATATLIEEETDDSGRFGMLLRISGPTSVRVTMDGYQPTILTHNVGRESRPIVIELLRVLTQIDRLVGRELLAGLDADQLTADMVTAEAALQRQDFPAAVAGYSALIEILPEAEQLHLRLGQALRAMNKNEEAMAAFRVILEINPENAEAQAEIQRTELYMSGGDPAAVIDETILTKEDLYNLGERAFSAGDNEGAREWYMKATDVDPNWELPWWKLAMVALNTGEFDLAKQHLGMVVLVAPNSTEGTQAKATLAALP